MSPIVKNFIRRFKISIPNRKFPKNIQEIPKMFKKMPNFPPAPQSHAFTHTVPPLTPRTSSSVFYINHSTLFPSITWCHARVTTGHWSLITTILFAFYLRSCVRQFIVDVEVIRIQICSTTRWMLTSRTRLRRLRLILSLEKISLGCAYCHCFAIV